jgi:hypothetical protein
MERREEHIQQDEGKSLAMPRLKMLRSNTEDSYQSLNANQNDITLSAFPQKTTMTGFILVTESNPISDET